MTKRGRSYPFYRQCPCLRYFFLCTIVKNKFNVWDILFLFKQPLGTFSFIASSCCRTYGFCVAFVFFLVVPFLLSWGARLRIEILNRETQGKCINCKARSLKCFLDKEKNNLWWVLKPSTVKKKVGFGTTAKAHFEACALCHFWASLLPPAVVEVTVVICLKILISAIDNAVKPLLSRRLRDLLKCPLNRGPLDRGCKNCAMFV